MRVTNKQINQWGSYTDRADNYDDSADIAAFVDFMQTDKHLKEYIKLKLPGAKSIRPKPDGDFGVDVGISDTENVLGILDIERWSAWKEDWPSHYMYISFLSRKDKYLDNKLPFFMVYFNYTRHKLLIVDGADIKQYAPRDKSFASGKGIDRIRPIPFWHGHIFGQVTEREKQIFKYAGD
jgi:hypothetical protein